MPVVDTSFLIRLQAGDEDAKGLLQELESEPLIVPPWVVVEFLTGHTDAPQQVLERLRRAFSLVETTPGWALVAAAFRKTMHAKGARIRLPDFWIASFARLYDTFVITQNVKHFDDLGVRVRTW